MLEIDLGEQKVMPGDAGALLCIEDNGQMKAFATLVATATKKGPPEIDANDRTMIYTKP